MRENILNLPQYLRRLRLVSSEQVALAMTGEYTCNFLFELNQSYDPEQYRAAHAFHECIIDAVDQGLLTYTVRWQGQSGETTGACFEPDEIWSWALAELSDSSPWYGASEAVVASVVSPPADVALPPSGGGNETQRLLIAGLARLLIARSHSAYLYGKKPNVSALARDAAAEVAYSLPPDADKTESFRKALSEALSLLSATAMQEE